MRIMNAFACLGLLTGMSAVARAETCPLEERDLSGTYLHQEDTGGTAAMKLSRVSPDTYAIEVTETGEYSNIDVGTYELKIGLKSGFGGGCYFGFFDHQGRQINFASRTFHSETSLRHARIGEMSDGSLRVEVPGFSCGYFGSPCSMWSTLSAILVEE